MSVATGLQGVIYGLTSGTRAAWPGTVTNNIVQGGAAPSGLVKAGRVRDVDIDGGKDEVDFSSRDSTVEKIGTALRKYGLTFTALFDTSDAIQMQLLGASAGTGAGNYVPLFICSNTTTTPNALGYWADWEVLSMKKSEKFKDAQMWDISLKPSGYSLVDLQIVLCSGS